MEIWKDIDNSCYQVSNLGRVKNIKSGKILKDATSKSLDGYRCVSLVIDGSKRTMLVHRLVFSSFVKNNLLTKEQVNHKDLNKSNNNLNNLELLDNRGNITHRNLMNDNLTSKYTGVSFYKKNSKWISFIRINKKSINLGYFDDEISASRMYNTSLLNVDKYDGDNKKFRRLCQDLNYRLT